MLVLMVKGKDGKLLGTNGYRWFYPHRKSNFHEGLVEIEKEVDKGTYSFIFGKNVKVDEIKEREDEYIYYTIGSDSEKSTFYTKNCNQAIYCLIDGEEIFVSGEVTSLGEPDVREVNKYRRTIIRILKESSSQVDDKRSNKIRSVESEKYIFAVANLNGNGYYGVGNLDGESINNMFTMESHGNGTCSYSCREGIVKLDKLKSVSNGVLYTGENVKETASFDEIVYNGFISDFNNVDRVYEKNDICIWREFISRETFDSIYSYYFVIKEGDTFRKITLYKDVKYPSKLYSRIRLMMNTYFGSDGKHRVMDYQCARNLYFGKCQPFKFSEDCSENVIYALFKTSYCMPDAIRIWKGKILQVSYNVGREGYYVIEESGKVASINTDLVAEYKSGQPEDIAKRVIDTILAKHIVINTGLPNVFVTPRDEDDIKVLTCNVSILNSSFDLKVFNGSCYSDEYYNQNCDSLKQNWEEFEVWKKKVCKNLNSSNLEQARKVALKNILFSR